MAPIKIGIVGLSTKPFAWANIAHWPYLKTSTHYQITGVCNSSLASSQAAVEHFGLTGAKAHDSYESLANDPNVELVVISTRTDTHYAIAKPALLAGKSIYCEWPLGANVDEAREMAALAKQNGCRTIVGLQQRTSQSILAAKRIVESGRLGEIHSANFSAVTAQWQDSTMMGPWAYMAERKIGANMLTVYGGHLLDSLTRVVGELETWESLAGNFRSTMKVRNMDGTLSNEEIKKDSPDQLMLIGRVKGNPGAMVTFHLRAGDQFLDQPGAWWKIYGTKGELQMTFKSAGVRADKLEICWFKDGQKEAWVEDVSGEIGEVEEKFAATPEFFQDTGRLYDAFATGKAGVDYADWDHAVKRHEVIDGFYKNFV